MGLKLTNVVGLKRATFTKEETEVLLLVLGTK